MVTNSTWWKSMLKTLPSIRAQIAMLPGLPEANRPYFEDSLIDRKLWRAITHTKFSLRKWERFHMAWHGVPTSSLLKHKGVLVMVHSAATHGWTTDRTLLIVFLSSCVFYPAAEQLGHIDFWSFFLAAFCG